MHNKCLVDEAVQDLELACFTHIKRIDYMNKFIKLWIVSGQCHENSLCFIKSVLYMLFRHEDAFKCIKTWNRWWYIPLILGHEEEVGGSL